MAEQEREFFGDVAGGGFLKWHCLGVSVGVVHNHEYLLMAPGQLRQWLHEVHAYSFEGDSNDGEGNQRDGCWLPGSSSLALGATLAEYPDLCIHAWQPCDR